MNFTILADRKNKTVAYAAEELERVLRAIDPTLTPGNGGFCFSLQILPPGSGHDDIAISVEKGIGTIAGEGPRGVLLAVYRFLTLLGCRWTFPGPEGEHIPQIPLTAGRLSVTVRETPSYRYRGVCIEGAVSEENVREMIEYLPRVGMNAYFIQFVLPVAFFQRWYEHWQSKYLPKEAFSRERVAQIRDRLAEEISLRGLMYQAVGHGWTCEPFGVHADGWNTVDENTVGEEYLSVTAMLDGKRGLYKGTPLNTNLCYSDPLVRGRMIDGVVDFCRANPTVDTVHFWLADALNNQCECPECVKMTPADWYVRLLNELDDRLTAEKMDTRIVFLLYFDLLYAPKTEKLHDSGRFILMFAPISRTYSETLAGALEKGGREPDEYVRNKIVLPKEVYTNIAFLRQWQKQFRGDGFLFDYHLMWDHMRDPGYTDCARVLFEDMENIDKLGLNGMISCQLSRVGMPTGFPMYAMARALWDKNADFEEVRKEYFTEEFGEEGEEVLAYLSEVTRLFCPPYLRHEKPAADAEEARSVRKIPALVCGFRAAHPAMRSDSPCEAWRTLSHHGDCLLLYSELIARRAEGQPRHDLAEALRTLMSRMEPTFQRRIDLWNYNANAIGQLEYH